MRVLAFSDLHMARARAGAIVAASADADLVIGAGDFCNHRERQAEAMDLLAGLGAPMIAVPGNAESDAELRAAAHTGTTVLHGTSTEVGGLAIFGLGGAVPETPFGAWSWDISEAEATKLLAVCDRADIMVIHSPPKGLADESSAGASLGSVAVREAIERVQPRLALCGHIHESWGVEGQIGATRVVNLGPTPHWFEL